MKKRQKEKKKPNNSFDIKIRGRKSKRRKRRVKETRKEAAAGNDF